MTTPKTQAKASASNRLPPFQMTSRDAQIVGAVATYRALTSFQVAALFFPSPTGQVSARCLARLNLLFRHGYLGRVQQPVIPSDGRKPYVYVLEKLGMALLADATGIEVWPSRERPGPMFLEHLLATNDVRIAISQAAAANGWSIEEWQDDHELASQRDYVMLDGPHGARQRAAVVPDAYFRLRAGQHVYHHFLEVDRGTVVGQASAWDRRDFGRKVRAVTALVDSGAFSRRFPGAKGLRQLTITTSPSRADNLREVAQKNHGRSRFWFTTFDQVTRDTALSQPIWSVASRGDDRFTLTW